jgi:hypothetical protein
MMKPILSGDKNCYMMKRLFDFIENFGSETPSFYDGFTVKY